MISINDTEAEQAEMATLLANSNVLLTTFQDDPTDNTTFTRDTAVQIIDFVKQHSGGNFLVHCYMGVSRSVAVAKWINEYLGLDDGELSHIKYYNKLVYDVLQEVTQNEIQKH